MTQQDSTTLGAKLFDIIPFLCIGILTVFFIIGATSMTMDSIKKLKKLNKRNKS